MKSAILKDLKHLREKSNDPIAKLAYSMSMDVVEHHFEKYTIPESKESIMKNKILAFESGGDWADASVEYMVNTSEKTGEELFDEYQKSGGYHGNGKKLFMQWAIENGYCREPNENEIEIVQDL